MKKTLLIGIMGFCSLFGFAQSTIQTAIPMTEGDNSYTLAEATQNATYFSYTAPADHGVLLKLTKASTSLNFQVTTDGTYQTSIDGISQNSYLTQIFPVKAGQTVYVGAAVYGGTEIKFSASVEEADVESGVSTEKPIVVEAGKKFFIPSGMDKTTYTTKPTYMKYTAAGSDVLQLTFESGSPSQATISEWGVEGAAETQLNYTSGTNNTYIVKTPVEKGKTYLIKANFSQPAFATAEEIVMVEGESLDLPFHAAEGEVTLPKRAGKFWYEFKPGKKGFAEITSEASLPSGTVNVYNGQYNANSGYSMTSVTGKLALRFETDAYSTYYICVEKTEATDADETFSLKVEEAKPGDTFDNPIALDGAGSYTTPADNGTYYYSLTSPADGNYMLNITVPEDHYINADGGTMMALFYSYSSSYSIASGKRSLSYQVGPNSSFILSWKLDEGTNSIPFTISFDKIAQGDLISDPIEAKLGENNLKESDKQYYYFTPEKSGWLTIVTEPNFTVTFPTNEGEYAYNDATVLGDGTTKMKVTAGSRYLIKFAGISEDNTFTLSIEDFQKGESIDNPIEVTSNSVELPVAATDNWYLYKATKAGRLYVESDMADLDGNPNQLIVRNGLHGSDQYFRATTTGEGGSSSATTFGGSIMVNEGDEVYVHVVLHDAQKNEDGTNKSVTFRIADPQPGESEATPKDLTAGANTIDVATRLVPMWYSIEVPEEGELKIVSTDDVNYYFSSELYATDDKGMTTGYALAYSNNNYTYNETTQTYDVNCSLTYNAQPGKYILKVNEANAPIAVEVTIPGKTTAIYNIASASDTITTGNGQINTNSPSTIYDLSGRKVAEGQGTIHVGKGVYIVRTSGKSFKVSVK